MSAPSFAADNPHGLILYDHPSSPCARRVRITLLEKGLAWETRIIDLSRLEQRRAAYLALNPNGVVPTLAHGERVIYESNVITEYLDDQFPDVPLYPSDPWELAQVKMWQAAELAMAKDYRPLMYQRVMGPMIRLTRTLDATLDAARRSTTDPADLAWEEKVWRLAVLTPEQEEQTVDRLWAWLAALERHLDGRAFLVGERFTQAEISLFPRVMMYAFVQLPIAPERFPNVARWMGALQERPSFVRTLSRQDAQLLALSRRPLLAWLGRTLKKPERERGLGERLRLFFVRRMARRAMGDGQTRREPSSREPLPRPRTGAIPPAERPAKRGPGPSPELRVEPITLYDYAHSPHARRIRILLREKGLSCRTVEVDVGRLAHKTPAFLAINPNGEVPALRHGERVLYDSQLIAEYLDRVYPGVPLYPTDAYLTAQVRMWLALEAGTHKEFRPLFWLHVVRPELVAAGLSSDDVDAIAPAGVHPAHRAWLRDVLAGTPRFDTSPELARAIIRQKLDVLDRRLRGRDHLVGDALSMADIAWFTRVDLLPRLGITIRPGELPNLSRWAERLAARPSFAASGGQATVAVA